MKNANEPNYLTFIDYYNPLIDPNPDLGAGDGKNVVIEGHVAPSFYMIKPSSNKLGISLSFQGMFTLRLIDDNSSPMIPPSNKAGFRFDYLFRTDNDLTTFFTAEVMHFAMIYRYFTGHLGWHSVVYQNLLNSLNQNRTLIEMIKTTGCLCCSWILLSDLSSNQW